MPTSQSVKRWAFVNWIWPSLAQLGDQNGLLGVIGDGAGRHVRCNGLVSVNVFRAVMAPGALYLLAARVGWSAWQQGPGHRRRQGAIFIGHFDAQTG